MSNLRNNWTLDEVLDLFNKPFNELLFKAHDIHIKNHKKRYGSGMYVIIYQNRWMP